MCVVNAGRRTVFNEPWFWKDFQNATSFQKGQSALLAITCSKYRNNFKLTCQLFMLTCQLFMLTCQLFKLTCQLTEKIFEACLVRWNLFGSILLTRFERFFSKKKHEKWNPHLKPPRNLGISKIPWVFRAQHSGTLHGLVVPLRATSWDKLDWDRFHRGHRACPATRTGLQRGYMTGLFWPFPVRVGQVWDKHNLSHWDKHSLSQSACPTGTGTGCVQWLVPVGQVWYTQHPSKAGPWPSLGSFLIKNQRGPSRIPEIPYQ